MNRGGFGPRTKPLVAHTGLVPKGGGPKRRKGLFGSSKPATKRPAADKPKTPQQERRTEQLATWSEIKQQAAQRDGFRCVGCGTDQWLETHHRHLKQAGGSKLHDHIANALTLCREHHEYAHAHRNTDAIALGWCVLQGENPAVHPIRAHDGFLYLHDDEGGRRRVG